MPGTNLHLHISRISCSFLLIPSTHHTTTIPVPTTSPSTATRTCCRLDRTVISRALGFPTAPSSVVSGGAPWPDSTEGRLNSLMEASRHTPERPCVLGEVTDAVVSGHAGAMLNAPAGDTLSAKELELKTYGGNLTLYVLRSNSRQAGG